MAPDLRPISWIGRSLEDLRAFPNSARAAIGHALYVAQRGERHRSAKPLKGFGGASVLEVVEDHDGDTYRAVYTVRFEETIYVLHCFQKKSKSGKATPKRDIALIRQRLKIAQQEHERWQEKPQRKKS